MVLDKGELKMEREIIWLVKKYLALHRAFVYCRVLWLHAQCRNSHIKAKQSAVPMQERQITLTN